MKIDSLTNPPALPAQSIPADKNAGLSSLPAEAAKTNAADSVAAKAKAEVSDSKILQYLRTLPARLAADNSYCLPIPREKLVETVVERKVMKDGSEIVIKVVKLEDLLHAAIDVAAPGSARSVAEEKALFEYLLTEHSMNNLNNAARLRSKDQPQPEKGLDELHWEAIEDIQKNYLEIFLQASTTMNDFYKDFINIKSTLGSFLQPGSGDGNVKFSSSEFRKKIDDLISKYKSEAGQLFPPADANDKYGTTDKKTAENWIKQMGLSENCLKDDGKGNYWVQIDLQPLQSMSKDLESLGSDENISMAKYNAWVTGFDSQAESLQTAVQMLTQKMTNANSVYDQLVKILSAFIQQNAEARRAYLS